MAKAPQTIATASTVVQDFEDDEATEVPVNNHAGGKGGKKNKKKKNKNVGGVPAGGVTVV